MIAMPKLLTPAEFVAQFVISQGAFAKLLGISPQYLSDMLGERRKINATMADRMARALRLNQGDRRTLHRLGALADGWDV